MKHCQYRPTITTATDFSHLKNENSKQIHKRAEQISHLHQQFQELKQKIKEVQTKNEKIIEKIHRAYNFKKKNIYAEEKSRDISPIIHYEKKHYPTYFGAMSVDGFSNKEDYEYDVKNQKKLSTPKKKQKRHEKLNNAEEKQMVEERNSRNEIENSAKQNQTGMPPMRSQSQYNLLYLQKKITSLDEALNYEKCRVQELEEELNGKGMELTKLKSIEVKFKNYSKTVKHLIENSLEEFMEKIVQRNFLFFEKGIKKNDTKLKNIKNLMRILKDKHEEKKSTRLIEEGKRRRSKSRSRRESPKTQNKDLNRSRSKLNEQYEKNKQFQQIANRYEEIIRTKTLEIEKWDKKYKTKERQCHELKVRAEILQKKIADEEKKCSHEFEDHKLVHKFSIDSNLLEDEELPRMEFELKQKDAKILQLSAKIDELQKKLKFNNKEYKENLQKSKDKMVEDYDAKMKEYEGNLSEKNKDLLLLRNKLADLEKKNLEKDCDHLAVENKLKKVEALLQNKTKKIQELEQLLVKEESHPESIEKSLGLDGSSNSTEVKNMKEYLNKIEEELDSTKTEKFSLMKNYTFYMKKVEELQQTNIALTKEVEALQIENEQFKISTSINNISAVEEQENLLNFNEDKDDPNQIIKDLEKAKNDIEEKYQILKATHLKKQSEHIKQSGELQYTKKVLSSLEEKYEKIKQEHDRYKEQAEELQKLLLQNQKELEFEREENQGKINEIQRQWVEFEEQMKEGKSKQLSELKSQKSSRFNYKEKYDGVSTQNEYLAVKLKEVETELELQKSIEEKILREYKTNTEKTKLEYKSKIDENESLKEENQMLKKKINNLNLRVSSEEKKSGGKSEENNQIFQKIQSLENQLRETREINSRLTEMETQLFKEMKLNEEEKVELMEEIENNRTKIKELEDLLEMKESGNSGNPHQSHISASSNKKESIKSQSSLKYSTNSQLLMSASHLNSRRYRGSGIDFDLSEAGSSFFEPSVFSNVEQIFDKEELPYERMKIKRKEQIKLLQKTSSYIKSLKKAIDEKSKKIKVLEKKIESLKSSQLVRKDLRPDKEEEDESENNFEDVFRDYQSVQLEKRKGNYHRKYKQLEDDTKLIVQENRLLNQQIEGLEEELVKAEEQENSLVKIKDLYKDEIKKLIKKNDDQARQFEEQLNMEKEKVEMADSYHTIETIKQLLFKIVAICCLKFTEDHVGTKKKDEKKKELEDCVNIISNVLKLDKKAKEGLLAMMHK